MPLLGASIAHAPRTRSTPLVVWHASAGLFCYDYAGNEIWKRNLGEFAHMWGYGTSPVLFRDRVILHTGPGKRNLLLAVSLKDGSTLWEVTSPSKQGPYGRSLARISDLDGDGADDLIVGSLNVSPHATQVRSGASGELLYFVFPPADAHEQFGACVDALGDMDGDGFEDFGVGDPGALGGRGRITLPGMSFTTSTKIPREVYVTGESRIVGDLMDGNLAGMHDGTIAIGIRHVLCVPLSVSPMSAGPDDGIKARVIGVLYLDGRERGTMLSQQTRSSLEAFATQAALAIESARLYAEAAEKGRIERDLHIAADIQRALLPEGSYENSWIDLAAASVPCRTVGGDFFDYIELGERGFGFALGDVAGKGPPAALLAAAVQTNFGAQAPVSDDPADTMTRINRALLRRAIEARFATMFHGSVLADGRLAYCNAGQEPPLVVRKSDVAWLEEGGPVLGLLSIATYECGTAVLGPGDLVVVCSDGVTEARNRAGDEFGRDRLVESMARSHGDKPELVLERLLEDVRKFSEGAAQADDITALVLRYRGSGV